MTPEEAGNKAECFFKSGFNCAQSVASVFAEQFGLDQKTLLKISQGFGGGMARMREVCGAVSGMIMVISYLLGSDDPQDKKSKDECYKVVQELCQKFRQKNGSIVCRELLGLVPMGQSQNALENGQTIEHKIEDSTSLPRTSEYYKKRPCALLCHDAAAICCEYIMESLKT